jgi:hypothetical protein
VARLPTTRSGRRKIGPSDAATVGAKAPCPRGVRAERGFEPLTAFTPRLLAFAGILGYLSTVSLSTFVERKDVKEYLRVNVPKPWFQVKAEIKAPPLTTAYGWAGTSLDYLLRFYLQKLNGCAKESGWVAEESLAILERSRVAPSALKRARAIVVKARKLHREYLKEKRVQKPNEALVCAAIDLAQLDLVKRIGRLELLPIDGAMVEDVSNMLALVRADDFRAKRTCVLNPAFGAASQFVGGADGDIFIDGTLIDIKVNKNLELGRDIFNQLLGYYCLSCIAGVDGCRGKVTCVAVYFARFGVLHRIPVVSFVEETRLPALLEWFKATASAST